MLNYFPKFFSNRAIGLYSISLLAISLFFFNNMMSPMWILIGGASAIGFFYFSNTLTRKWANFSEKRFVKNIFWTAFFLRVIWVIFSYLFYQMETGRHFEFGAADSLFYDEMARYGSDLMASGEWNLYEKMTKYAGRLDVSDFGYPLYLSFVYLLSAKSILIAQLIKAAWGAWTVVLVYRLSQRSFGEEVGKIAGIFTMLMPILIYYSGLHLKEVEMVFLTVAFVERADYLLRSQKFSLINIIVPLMLAVLLFTFRTVLGVSSLFALFTTLVFSNSRGMLGWKKRLVVSTWFIVAVGFFMGGRIANEVEEVWAGRDSNQEQSLEWRANREGGNSFATYANKVAFAPLIFNIPIPTMVEIPAQENIQLLNGGNYVKEVLVFFLYLAFIQLFKSKRLKEYLLMFSFVVGYLAIVALSAFAQSERYHQPTIPFLLIFAAFGITIVTNNQKKYFNWYLPFLFLMFVFWQWFKLKGRGLI